MRTIPSLEQDALLAFVGLFDSTHIYSIEIVLHDGTETGVTEFEDIKVSVFHGKQTVSGKTLESCLAALKRLHYNQICEVRVTLDNYKQSSLDMIGRRMMIHGADTLPVDKIKKYKNDFELEKTELLF